MKLNLALILAIIVAVGLVAFGFTVYQISSERAALKNELKVRATQVAEEIFQSDTALIQKINRYSIEAYADSLSKRFNLLGLAVYYNKDSVINNLVTRNYIIESKDYISESIAADSSIGKFINVK